METGDRRSDEPLPSRLVESIKEIGSLPECGNYCKKMYDNLVRSIKLLSPLFQELKDGGGSGEIGEGDRRGFEMLGATLDSAVAVLIRMKLGDEEEDHDDGGDEGDHAVGERASVEILVNFGIRVQIPKLVEYAVHLPLRPQKQKSSVSDRGFLAHFPVDS